MPSKRQWTLALGLCALLTHGGAWAIHQCVGPDGKVSFQDAPCAPDQTSKEVDLTPSSKGINPTQGSAPRPAQRKPAPSAAASAPASQAKVERPADCPSPEEMQKLQVQAESIALPLPIRNQNRQEFEALKARCQ